MPDIKEKAKQVAALSADAKKLYAEMESDSAKNTTENREKIEKMIADGEKLQSEIKEFKRIEALEEFATAPEEKGKFDENTPAPELKSRKSWGQQFVGSDSYKSAVKNNRPETEAVEVKALYTDTTTPGAGGVLIRDDLQSRFIDRTKLAQTTLLDILNMSQTNSNLISYYVTTGYTNNAAPVKDFSAGNFGLKPQSDLAFGKEDAPVRTIAHWVGIHRNMIADAPAVRGVVDGKLIMGLERVLETQVIGGNGTGENLRGIVNTPGVQKRFLNSVRGDAADTKADQIRRAITDVTLAFGRANAIVVNPVEAEAFELIKDNNKNYINIFDPILQRLWRTRVVENRTIADNKYIVGDFMMGCTLYMREMANVRMSENVADYFIRNAIVLLAELRAAFAVEEPEMFVDGSFAASV